MVYVILIVGISFLILFHELGHFLAAKFFGRWVEEFGIGFPPRLFGKKIGETVYSVNALPFGGFVRIHGEKPEFGAEGHPEVPSRSFARLPAGPRSAIIGAGVLMNFFVGWFLLSAIFMVGTPPGIVVAGVAEGSPAALAGVTSGDRILDFETVDSFMGAVNESRGREMILRVSRSGDEFSVTALPRKDPPPGEGALGVNITSVGAPKLPFFASIREGFMSSAKVLGAIFISLTNLVSGIFTGGPALENFVGPVGIFGIANEAARFGLVYLFQLIALISLNLVVLNIVPLPALDGGRLFFILIEKIKGSPVSPKREGLAHAIGFGLLILLMVAITIRDIVKIL